MTSTYEEPADFVIYDAIHFYSTRLNLSKEIYELGAEAHQMHIERFPYPQLLTLSKHYNNMAELYWRANDKLKAIEAQQKAIEALRTKKDLSSSEMEAFKSLLQKYKNM